MVMSMKMAVFWVVALCSLVEVYHRFRGPCCLHHQDDEYDIYKIRYISQTDSMYMAYSLP
jgi:hypothetical protein